MGKITNKEAFLKDYRRLKSSGAYFGFTALARQHKLTLNEARGIVGGSAAKTSQKSGRPRKRVDVYKLRKESLVVPKIHESDVPKVVKAVEDAVEAAIGSPVKAEVGYYVAEYIGGDQAKPGEDHTVVEKTEDQKTIESLKAQLKSCQAIAEHRGNIIDSKNKRIVQLEQKLGEIVFNQNLV